MKIIVSLLGIFLGVTTASSAYANNFDFSFSAIQREEAGFRIGTRYFVMDKTAASLSVGSSGYKAPDGTSEKRAANAHFLLGIENVESVSPTLAFRSGFYGGVETFKDYVADPNGKSRKASLIGFDAGISKRSSTPDIKMPQIGFGVAFELRGLPDKATYYGGTTKLNSFSVAPSIRFDF